MVIPRASLLTTLLVTAAVAGLAFPAQASNHCWSVADVAGSAEACSAAVLFVTYDENNPNDLSDVVLYAVDGYYDTEHQTPGWTTNCILNEHAPAELCVYYNALWTGEKAEAWSSQAQSLPFRFVPLAP